MSLPLAPSEKRRRCQILPFVPHSHSNSHSSSLSLFLALNHLSLFLFLTILLENAASLSSAIFPSYYSISAFLPLPIFLFLLFLCFSIPFHPQPLSFHRSQPHCHSTSQTLSHFLLVLSYHAVSIFLQVYYHFAHSQYILTC